MNVITSAFKANALENFDQEKLAWFWLKIDTKLFTIYQWTSQVKTKIESDIWIVKFAFQSGSFKDLVGFGEVPKIEKKFNS